MAETTLFANRRSVYAGRSRCRRAGLVRRVWSRGGRAARLPPPPRRRSPPNSSRAVRQRPQSPNFFIQDPSRAATASPPPTHLHCTPPPPPPCTRESHLHTSYRSSRRHGWVFIMSF
ncbi:hypothetical protein O3G_MSEX015089 [Manduca sexta]|uniref:Uncharacterized protein n=1 Tax=Manduca sexta TaxID=7130 RepID=A0A921ZXM8_MANSE|nr:hypothetical protein O3G_MSEX015089 [Manduca sexta]KAG6465345.1 hypothetical protein O3G_MSEX015089 [Manduca sexta]